MRWRERVPDLAFFEERIANARAAGDAWKIKAAAAAYADFRREIARLCGNPMLQRSHRTETLAAVIQSLDSDIDNYISQAIFRRPRRRVIDLQFLSAYFCDLDYDKTAKYGGRPPKFVATAAEIVCADLDWPPPSEIIASGHGLYVKWLLSAPVPPRGLPRWQALQRAIGDGLKQFGADPIARDASRVLRWPGTFNTKAKRPVAIIRFDGAAHDFEALCERMLPFSREQRAQSRLAQAAGTSNRAGISWRRACITWAANPRVGSLPRFCSAWRNCAAGINTVCPRACATPSSCGL
jgi:hypothetical protein